MNQEQITSLIRQALLFAGGVLVSRGYVDSETMLAIVGAVLTIGASAWAIYSRRTAGLVASAAALPNTRQIVTDQATADAVPSLKVVGGR